MTIRLTREQLYALVWSEAMQRLAKQIGISDVAIAKHCRRMDIPVPERGYWNKLQAGHAVKRTPLAPRDLGTDNSVEMSGTLTPELLARISGKPGQSDTESESIEVLADRFRKRLGKVSVPRNFQNTHPIVAKLLQKDEEIRAKKAASSFYWREPRFDAPFERRRLRFLNGLFLAYAKVGGSPWMRADEERDLSIHMGSASSSFEVEAVGHNTSPRGGRREAAPDARMYLSVKGESEARITMRWEDREGCKLEDQLTDIVVGMAIAGEHQHRSWLVQQAAWRQKQREDEEREAMKRKEEAERRERERLAAAEKARSDTLLAEAKAWRDADLVRAYVGAVRRSGALSIPDLETWAQWALAEADRLDPLSPNAPKLV
jgi:hypothetical protein